MVIVQPPFDGETVQCFFIRESESLQTMNDHQYRKMLDKTSKEIKVSASGQDVVNILTQTGYKVVYLQIPIDQFVNYPVFGPSELDLIFPAMLD